jgi:dTDP-4-amino-4,6-dideoxygalactose transaminase
MIRMLRDHGSPKKYQHLMVGTNSRLDAIQAAVLSVKLPYLDRWNALRVQHAKDYVKGLAGSDLYLPQLPPDGEHNFHLFVVRARRRDALQNCHKAQGIESGIHYPVPLHLTPAYQELSYPGRGSLPVAEALAEEILSLPMYAELAQEQIDYLVSTVQDFSDHG